MAYNTDIRPGETTEHYYHRIAKVADQRLNRLEKLSQEKGFEGVTEYAYRNAQKALDVWGGNRFNTKMPESANLRNEKIADMIHFIESKTSTKGGIVNTYEKRAKTLSEKYGPLFPRKGEKGCSCQRATPPACFSWYRRSSALSFSASFLSAKYRMTCVSTKTAKTPSARAGTTQARSVGMVSAFRAMRRMAPSISSRLTAFRMIRLRTLSSFSDRVTMVAAVPIRA